MPYVLARMRRIIAAAAGADWLTGKRISAYAALLTVAYTASLAWLLSGHRPLDPLGRPIGTDFILFYSVSTLIHSGNPQGAYVPATLHAVQSALTGNADGYWPWTYPPHALFAVYPFATLPYLAAFSLAMVLGSAALLFVFTRTAQGPMRRVGLMIAAPAFFLCITHGQLTLPIAAALGAGLLYLRSSPAMAGMLLGLATTKPHLGLLFPVALVAGRHWRAAAAAAATTLALLATSCLVFDHGIILTWIRSLPVARFVIENGGTPWAKQGSVFSAFRSLATPAPLAYAAQLAVIIVLARYIAVAWRSTRADHRVQNAMLLAASVLASPHIMLYDYLLVVMAIGWLVPVWHEHGFIRWEALSVALAWATPIIALAVLAPLAPFAAALLLIAIVRRTTVPPAVVG